MISSRVVGHFHAEGFQPVRADRRGPDAILHAILGDEGDLTIAGVGGIIDHALRDVLLVQGQVGVQLARVDQQARVGELEREKNNSRLGSTNTSG